MLKCFDVIFGVCVIVLQPLRLVPFPRLRPSVVQ